MKRTGTALLALVICAMLANPPLIRAQATADEKPKADVHVEKVTPLKIQVVLTEYDGDKKVKSLPYATYVNADRGYQFTKMRIGTKVPVYAGKDSGMQYIDVGTNIDCRAAHADVGGFRVELVVERSWVESDVLIPVVKPAAEDKSEFAGQFKQPIIRQFKTEMEISLRDGQTTESTVATDPLSGKVLKIDVSLSVLK